MFQISIDRRSASRMPRVNKTAAKNVPFEMAVAPDFAAILKATQHLKMAIIRELRIFTVDMRKSGEPS